MPDQGSCVICTKSEVIDKTAADVAALKGDISDIKIGQNRLTAALIGDEFNPDGLLQKRDRDHKRIVRIERVLYMVGGGAAVITALVKLFLR